MARPVLRSVPTSNLAPIPAVTPPGTWPIPGDIPDIKAIIADQSETIAAQAVLIDAYQANLNAAQNPPPGTPATATGTTATSSTSLNVNGVTGVIIVGSTVTDTGTNNLVPAGTEVLGQISGTPGGAGAYLLNNAVLMPSGEPLAFTPPPPATTWPTPTDPYTLLLVQQMQATVSRIQSALLQSYLDLLNTSMTTPPPTGP